MAISIVAVGDTATAAWANSVANALNNQFLGDSGVVVSSVTLSTTSNFASAASVTFTLAAQARVRIDVQAQFQTAATPPARYLNRPAVNSGASPVIGSATLFGMSGSENTAATGGGTTVSAFGTILLAAGTWTAYGAVARNSGGSITDVCQSSAVLVTAVGFS